MRLLEVVANLAEILTAVIAGIAYLSYKHDQDKKREKLEVYLRSERQANPAKHTHTILNVMAEVALTYDEILKASFKSSHIERVVHKNRDTGLADDILLRYKD